MDRIEDIDKYSEAWVDKMLEIWREKIERLGIVRTGALHQSFHAAITSAAQGSTLNLKFLYYGIYQELGVGRGYSPNNGGDLPFLGKEYRREHGLDKPRKVGPAWGGYKTSGNIRKKRDWRSKKLYMSVMAMVEDMARILGDQGVHVICDNLMDPHSTLR